MDGIQKKINLRDAARQAGNFAEADRIRMELEALGIQLEDTGKETRWRYKRIFTSSQRKETEK